jgi:hypothetical protein
MADDIKLNSHHLTTLKSIFAHPVGHNIEWHDVVSLLGKLGTVVQETNERYTVTLGSAMRTFDEPHGHHNIDIEQVLQLRAMLEQAGMTPEALSKP